MKRYLIIYGTLFALLLSTAVSAVESPVFTEADSWLYQLQDANIDDITATDVDIVVMDYAQDGTDDTAYTQRQIQELQASGKIVLAYFSIGEAEDYRFYWDNDWDTAAPSWLGPENPDWEGNYTEEDTTTTEEDTTTTEEDTTTTTNTTTTSDSTTPTFPNTGVGPQPRTVAQSVTTVLGLAMLMMTGLVIVIKKRAL